MAVGAFSSDSFCMLMTGRGKIKRVAMEEFASVRPSGLIAMSLEEGDKLGWARLTSGKDEIIIVTENGQALRFNETKVRSMGRQAAGLPSEFSATNRHRLFGIARTPQLRHENLHGLDPRSLHPLLRKWRLALLIVMVIAPSCWQRLPPIRIPPCR